jgi:hypothetical protein
MHATPVTDVAISGWAKAKGVCCSLLTARSMSGFRNRKIRRPSGEAVTESCGNGGAITKGDLICQRLMAMVET